MPQAVTTDIQVTQQWLDQDIVGRGICPPLVKLMQRYREANGPVNWEQLSSEVNIISFRKLDPTTSLEPIQTVAQEYVQFVTAAVRGTAPYTKIIILPDFKTNTLYDSFMKDLWTVSFLRLLSPDFNSIAKAVLGRAPLSEGRSRSELLARLDGDSENRKLAVAQILEGVFRYIYFYGRKIQDQDIADTTLDRGLRSRYKILARAPFYMTQIINDLRSEDLVRNLNVSRVHQRNTELALREELARYEARMSRLRSQVRD